MPPNSGGFGGYEEAFSFISFFYQTMFVPPLVRQYGIMLNKWGKPSRQRATGRRRMPKFKKMVVEKESHRIIEFGEKCSNRKKMQYTAKLRINVDDLISIEQKARQKK